MALIQNTHDSHVIGYPGWDNTLAMLSMNLFRPGISKDVRKFCKCCDVCGRSHVWSEQKKGFLRPLPMPDKFNSELAIDFMRSLPAKTVSVPRYMMVGVDRLKRGMAIEEMTAMRAEDCTKVFLKLRFRCHGFPKHITSDRGSNWVGDFWRELCNLTEINQRLLIAFHPQTDGATKRMNQEILAYLGAFITYSQFNWTELLLSAISALNDNHEQNLE